ncbi:T cell receptor alpha variable 17 [Oncorhynchus tshawytscha]|uniref:T cell receptor alpha variable 17 n=1 Tax=Oncorhynchus tshawytscha TaxID=74940 RepID=UPI001C3E6CA9|nr:T cell receptor alpha variable 17 [Oncorhynchus tshawytscha]
MSLILLLLLSAFVGDSMEQETITPVKPEVNALQGTDITLSCNYKGNIINLQWYRHYPGSRPECLLWILQTNKYVQNTSITTPRHTGRLNEEKTRVDLMISSVELEDSALYHCALQPTVTGNLDSLYKNLSRHLRVNSALYFDQSVTI